MDGAFLQGFFFFQSLTSSCIYTTQRIWFQLFYLCDLGRNSILNVFWESRNCLILNILSEARVPSCGLFVILLFLHILPHLLQLMSCLLYVVNSLLFNIWMFSQLFSILPCENHLADLGHTSVLLVFLSSPYVMDPILYDVYVCVCKCSCHRE